MRDDPLAKAVEAMCLREFGLCWEHAPPSFRRFERSRFRARLLAALPHLPVTAAMKSSVSQVLAPDAAESVFDAMVFRLVQESGGQGAEKDA